MRTVPIFVPTIGGGDPSATAIERRAQALHAAELRTQERARQLEQQCSPMLSAEERIRLWEQLHALRLPRSGTHKLVELIATQTDLSLPQVHAEQQRRAEL
jgi:hypothetical protein